MTTSKNFLANVIAVISSTLLVGCADGQTPTPRDMVAEATTPATAICKQPNEAGDRALVIGVSKYAISRQNSNVRGSSLDLNGPRNDRENVKQLLLELGYAANQICVLGDEDATANAIRKGIGDWLIDGTKPGSRAFFYFSGHGWRTDGAGSPVDDEPFDQVLIAHDFTYRTGTTPASGFIWDDEIGRFFDQMADRHVTAVIDSCFSGTVYRGATADESDPRIALSRGLTLRRQVLSSDDSPAPAATRGPSNPQPPLELRPKSGLTVWSSSSERQLSWDDGSVSPTSGYFTHRWVKAVRESGNLEVTRVLANLQESAAAYCNSLGGICTTRNGFTPQLYAMPEVYLQGLRESLMRRGAVQIDSNPWPDAATAASQLGQGRISFRAHLEDDFRGRGPFRAGTSVRLVVTNTDDRRIHLTAFNLKDGKAVEVLVAGQVAPHAEYTQRLIAGGRPGSGQLVVVATTEPLVLRTASRSMEVEPAFAQQGAAPMQNLSNAQEVMQEALWTMLTPVIQPNNDLQSRDWGSAILTFDIED